jgi:hypothetical protein
MVLTLSKEEKPITELEMWRKAVREVKKIRSRII